MTNKQLLDLLGEPAHPGRPDRRLRVCGGSGDGIHLLYAVRQGGHGTGVYYGDVLSAGRGTP